MARILCTKELKADSDHHQSSIEAYVACRLIPLDKCPGVRPIGIGEVIRRIIGKSIISVIKPDILMSTGSLQLAAGLPSGCEAAAHAMEDIFQEEELMPFYSLMRLTPSILLIAKCFSITFAIFVLLYGNVC